MQPQEKTTSMPWCRSMYVWISYGSRGAIGAREKFFGSFGSGVGVTAPGPMGVLFAAPPGVLFAALPGVLFAAPPGS